MSRCFRPHIPLLLNPRPSPYRGVTRAWNISRAGVYRFRKSVRITHAHLSVAAPPARVGRRAGGAYPTTNRRIGLPRRGLSEDMGSAALRRGFAASPSRCDESWESTAYSRPTAPDGVMKNCTMEPHHHDKINEMWGTDMTQTVTLGEGRAYVFVAVEHANWKIVGIHARVRPIALRR